MFDLPLFPLNTVLFPGMPLQLHVFEERYKRMVEDCLKNKRPFGVVLIKRGLEAFGPLAEPHPIGCTARIVDIERLTDGRMNISVLGQQRFRIRETRVDKPYLIGQVELFPLIDREGSSLAHFSQALRPWVKRYMQILTQVDSIHLDPQQLPTEPLVLAYTAAVLLQVPPAQKQGLLASERAVDFFSDIQALYRREVALLQAMFAERKNPTENGFSLN